MTFNRHWLVGGWPFAPAVIHARPTVSRWPWSRCSRYLLFPRTRTRSSPHGRPVRTPPPCDQDRWGKHRPAGHGVGLIGRGFFQGAGFVRVLRRGVLDRGGACPTPAPDPTPEHPGAGRDLLASGLFHEIPAFAGMSGLNITPAHPDESQDLVQFS